MSKAVNRSALLMLVMAGCGRVDQSSQSAPTTLIEGAVLAQVSSNESFIAYYNQPSRLANGPYIGSLEVMPLPSGRAIPLGDGAFYANFDQSVGTLYFFQQPSFDANLSTYIGSLSIWTPKLDAPVALSAGYVPYSETTVDHSTTIFFDTPTHDETASGEVKLLQTGDCAGTSCPVKTLAKGLTLTAVRISLDGRYVAYDTTTVSDGLDTHDVFFASVAD